MKKKYLRQFMDSMLWTIPLFWAVVLTFIWKDFPDLLHQKSIWLYSLIASILMYLWLTTEFCCRPSPDSMLEEKRQVQQKVVRRELRSKKPEGILFGRRGKSYIRKPIAADGHVLVLGGSGSGKSSAGVIPTILANPGTSVFAIDIKGELSYKATKRTDSQVKVVNPSDRYSSGYDPLYLLTSDSTETEIYETMRLISESLISLPADLKDPFWKTSARNLLSGLLIYYYKSGTKTFIGLVDKILSKPIKDSVKEIMENADAVSTERRYMVQFVDLAEETLGGIVTEMNNHLILFANDRDIRYALRDNPNKATPVLLDQGYSIYLSIQEHKLTAYYDFLQLVLNQMFFEMEQRPETANPVLFIIDELPRILSAGKIERLLDGAKTLRSRKVTLYLIIQSVEALMSAYSESQAMDLISNCSYVMILDAASTKTQKMIVEWAGKFLHRKKSWSNGASKSSISTSFEEKNLIDAADIMQLKQNRKVMLVSPYGFYIIDKNPYYVDPILSTLSAECVTCNKNIK